MAAVLLRRVFLQLELKDLVEDLAPEVLSSCQAELLVAVQVERNGSIRRKICEAVAELARSSLGGWVRCEGPSSIVIMLDQNVSHAISDSSAS